MDREKINLIDRIIKTRKKDVLNYFRKNYNKKINDWIFENYPDLRLSYEELKFFRNSLKWILRNHNVLNRELEAEERFLNSIKENENE